MKLQKRKYKTIDGHRWAYIAAGNPNNPPIILVHGFMSLADFFNPVIRDLEKKYYVIAPDLPGFGFTSSLAENSASKIASGLVNFCKSFDFRQCSVFGVSLGGFITLSAAITDNSVFEKIIVQSPVWRIEKLKYGPLEWFQLFLASLPVQLLESLHQPDILKVVIKAALFIKPNLHEVWSRYEQMILQSLLLVNFSAVKDLWFSLTRTDISDKVDSIQTQSLLISSVDDKVVSFDRN